MTLTYKPYEEAWDDDDDICIQGSVRLSESGTIQIYSLHGIDQDLTWEVTILKHRENGSHALQVQLRGIPEAVLVTDLISAKVELLHLLREQPMYDITPEILHEYSRTIENAWEDIGGIEGIVDGIEEKMLEWAEEAELNE